MTLGYSFSQYVVQIIAGLGSGAVLFLVSAGPHARVRGAARHQLRARVDDDARRVRRRLAHRGRSGSGTATFWIVLILRRARDRGRRASFMEILFFRPIYQPAAARPAARDVRVRAHHRGRPARGLGQRRPGRSRHRNSSQGGVDVLGRGLSPSTSSSSSGSRSRSPSGYGPSSTGPGSVA